MLYLQIEQTTLAMTYIEIINIYITSMQLVLHVVFIIIVEWQTTIGVYVYAPPMISSSQVSFFYIYHKYIMGYLHPFQVMYLILHMTWCTIEGYNSLKFSSS